MQLPRRLSAERVLQQLEQRQRRGTVKRYHGALASIRGVRMLSRVNAQPPGALVRHESNRRVAVAVAQPVWCASWSSNTSNAPIM